MAHVSEEELLATRIRDMGEPLGLVYDSLTKELTWLHVKWRLYRQLYAKSPERIDLLKRTAGHFFGVLRSALADDIAMHLARLTDAAQSFGHDNLTVQRLPKLLPQEVKTDVDRLLDRIKTTCEPVRTWRNRRGAHTDLGIALSIEADPLPPISRAQIETALELLGAILNRLDTHYWKTAGTRYDAVVVAPPTDADSLVYYLMKGVRAEEHREQRLRDGKPLPEDLRPDEEIP